MQAKPFARRERLAVYLMFSWFLLWELTDEPGSRTKQARRCPGNKPRRLLVSAEAGEDGGADVPCPSEATRGGLQ